MTIQPYLFFNGRCEEAIEFYKTALGAKVEMLMRFKDNPGKPPPEVVSPTLAEKIMHASLRIGDSVVMASDGMCEQAGKFEGFGLSLPAADAREADRYFDALRQGGEVRMPMGKTFFSPRFGMVADKFGVLWLVIVEPPAT